VARTRSAAAFAWENATVGGPGHRFPAGSGGTLVDVTRGNPVRELIMTSHRIALVSVVLVSGLSGIAFAQGAPGMCGDCYAVAPPVVAPPPPPELSRNLGVGLHVSSLAIANEAIPDQPTELGGGGLQVRYRLNPRWELQVALDVLREHDADGMPIGPELHSATLGAMFHLRPLRRWDVYLLAAVGGVTERVESPRSGATDERGRGQVHLGIGLEHRWNRLGISAELRAVGIEPDEQGAMTTATPRPGSIPTAEIEAEPDQAGLFTLAATYFF
jgi:hypothetical protein